MKRAQSPCLHDNGHDERPAKVRRQESLSTPSGSLKREQEEQIKVQHPPSPFSPNPDGENPVNLEREATTRPSLTNTATEHTNEIFDWIPAPSEIGELDDMSQPASKRSRSRSISTDRGRARSLSSDSDRSSARDAKSSAYKAVNYVTILETKGCFMRQSSSSPHPDDIALCERLLHQPIEPPQGTLFDDEYITDFHNALQNRSEARLFVDLHPLLMPSAENQFIQGKTRLKDVIDGYNDLWVKTEPIYGPKPQPDHARGLKWSTFSESQRRRLGIKPDEKSPYTAREDMYFPYVTAEIKCGNQALELADRQNMHSMCIALRAVVSLSRAAGCPEKVHRRILGFSLSHELEGLRIYGYYPEIDGGNTSYFRWPVAQLNIWTKEDKWACYRFMENVDREFLPIHTDRLIRLLEDVPDLEEYSLSDDVEIESQVSRIGSQDRSGLRRTTSSLGRGLQPELRMMVQTLQQQLAEQKEREDKLLTQLERQREREEKREVEQKAREDRLLAQLEHLTQKLTDK
ncbi:uncharacterized protein TRUGW13939_10368 [Talaromyces rugulosus]|uniref:DUF7924 domain-containing protein n=1 Tax=Talaromyces rugulosus TaxID=121627 RepID=A0A7H8R9U1_TALRU|nr:uncharacterized protein TRUGW13939_10368 [Talaromyces rugulosus]QKX63199.1 hypothetical protein TRUGW13939_10368 [Talaromyces rugulosus]